MSPAPQRPHAPLNIHAVLERVLRLAETEGGWAVRMQRDYDPSIPEFSGDADRLTQAVWNLVRNALQASASTIILRTRVESGLHIRDHVHARALRVEIVDDGQAAHMQEIFRKDLTNCRRLTLGEWQQRGWWVRGIERLLRPLQPLL